MEVTPNGKAEDWRRRIEDQRASGQSVRAWCLANGTREHSFYWWRARLGLSAENRRRRARRKRSAEASYSPVAFAKVLVGASRSAAEGQVLSAPLHLRLAGGRELILPPSMSIGQMARLVRAIEGGGEACRATA
jgi:hypothetical protein